MDNLNQILSKLEDPNANVRLDACEQLRQISTLTADAIFALKRALNDPNPRVAEAVRNTLRSHEKERVNRYSSDPSMSVKKAGWFGKLHIAHVLFLIVGTGMAINAAGTGSWGATLFIVCFMIGCILFMSLTFRSRHQKLTGIWSELAAQTGLKLTEGQSYYIGSPNPPSLAGVYRGRRISVTKITENISAYEGSIPVVYTQIRLKLININNFQFAVGPKSFLKRIFRSGDVSGGKRNSNRRFQFQGYPESLLGKVIGWFDMHNELLERPVGVIMQTDYPLSAVSWSPPTIYIQGSELSYRQSGIVSNIAAQVRILDLLCDLAELVEYPVVA